MKLDSKMISLVVLTIAILIAGYWLFFTGGTPEAPLTGSSQANDAQQQFNVLVSELQPISFNTAIFTEPAFMSLVDLTTPLAPETSGRTDPFASLP